MAAAVLSPALVPVHAPSHLVPTGEETRTNHGTTLATEVIVEGVLAAVEVHAVHETRTVLPRAHALPFADLTEVAQGDARRVTSVVDTEDVVGQDLARTQCDPAGLAATLVHARGRALLLILLILGTAEAEVVPVVGLSADAEVAAAVEMISETAGQGHRWEKINPSLAIDSISRVQLVSKINSCSVTCCGLIVVCHEWCIFIVIPNHGRHPLLICFLERKPGAPCQTQDYRQQHQSV